MSALPDEVPSLMIPMHGRPWLVPNIIVAEIIRSTSSGWMH